MLIYSLSQKVCCMKESIIFISGSNGVGKTTIARKILEKHKEYIIIQNVDLLREIVRSMEEKCHNLTPKEQYILNSSAYELDFDNQMKQCKLLLRPIVSVCKRLHAKKIPAIIEGINICYNILLSDSEFIECLKKFDNISFINLYLSDEIEHFNRIINRNNDDLTLNKQINCFNNIRRNSFKIMKIEEQIMKSHNKKLNNIKFKNIDCSSNSLSKPENIKRILSIIESNIL